MLNRRNFLKIGAAAATTTVAAGASLNVHAVKDLPHWGNKDFSPGTGKRRQAIPSACWQCVTRCANIGYVEDGRLVKIESNVNSIRTEGVMCAKGQGAVNHTYDPDRILYPMQRVGERGSGQWKRISWDEALDMVAARMKKNRDAGTPEKVAFHYGRMKASHSKTIGGFFKAYGTGSIGNHTALCEGGKWTAQELTWGGHYDNWDFDNTKFVLNFGSNVLETHTNHIPTAHRLLWAMAEKGVEMVTFDVRLSNTAAKSKEWVPIKVGTDGAVLAAMINVVMKEGLYKGDGEEFLKYTRVTEDVNASVADKVKAIKAHVKGYTPKWAEKISGVPAKKITALARQFATTKPAVLVSYRGLVAHYNGNEGERLAQLLCAVTGQMDKPGTRMKAVGAGWKFPKIPSAKNVKKLHIFDGFPGQVAYPTHHVCEMVFPMIKDGKHGRPDMYIMYCYTPAYANGNSGEGIEVLKDEKLLPFLVAIDPFYGDSTMYADLILPDTPFTERWTAEDMVDPAQIGEFYIRQPFTKPLGEARDFSDVVFDLAKRLGLDMGKAKSHEDYVRLACENTPGVKEAGGFAYMKKHGVWHDKNAKPQQQVYNRPVPESKYKAKGVVLDKASGVYWKPASAADAKKGYVATKGAYKKYVAQNMPHGVFSGFAPDKVNKSGYLELWSPLLKAKGFNPMPTWIAIPEHQKMGRDDLILTTYKHATQTHSRTMNCKYLAEVFHSNPAWINPKTAKARGIYDGDRIKVTSDVGSMVTKARVTEAIIPGIVAVSHHCGHWAYGRYASGKRAPATDEERGDRDFKLKWWTDNGVHPNWVIPNSPDPINGQQRWMDTVVRVTRV
ncbi:MAG: molybdopterin-dependent oxidoreductase [Gammaproteobacteria bacterium]|nr:molybdopterin-dependent oxidoreductase [Gammaproteobacteria bacterium]